MRQFMDGELISVLTTQPLGGALDYRAPVGGCLDGSYVEVPLGPRKVLGVVWGPGEGKVDASRLRRVIRVFDVEPMRAEMKTFLDRAAEYTLTPMPAMLRLATRSPGLGDPPSMRRIYRRGRRESPNRWTDARRRVVAALDEFGGLAFTLGELTETAGVSTSVVKGLVAQGVLAEEESPRDQPFPALNPRRAEVALTSEQTEAAEALVAGVRSGRFGATLLKGVTGSGKTEVYLEAVAACLKAGRQALVLLPEIALTEGFLDRVEARFGARPAEWHSGVTTTERRRAWTMVAKGGAELVVGARSALFLPFRDLGLIVVDEEHDISYKQEEGVIYNARDMAVLRGSIANAQAVLSSATPSLETWVNAESGKYARLALTARFGAAVMPQMRAIDLREANLPANRWISDTLARAMKERIEAGEQALLFLNRRGYAPVTICRACGNQIDCDQCDAWLVEHRFRRILMCHQCGATRPVPDACPSCKVKGRMAPVGPGVERLAEEVLGLFPDARLAVLSSDLFGSAKDLKACIKEISEGGADVIVGTQIVAKGHNFPLLTLVGVIDADLGLQGSDLRAAERTFQLIRQVSGRAGRAERPGLALVQTCQPDHPVMGAILSGDEEEFWRAEAAARRGAGVPPFGRLAGIILSSRDAKAVIKAGKALAARAEPLRRIGAEVYGPAAAPVARIRGRHRVRLLVKAERGARIQGALAEWLAQVKLPASLRLSVDIDPQRFF
ncbi:MAG: primosomal protein N' [Boseongicola sp. SB0673_bin_14]|nr:primosomal protein N' [Boseongicola sp. SB0667_bin_21]MYI68173.1 primosomal protein N' [Boseongicola sp. SB0673_bin_14]